MKEKSAEVKHLEAEFYAKKFYLSYSGLSKLLNSPTLFYKSYILNQWEDIKGEHIDQGRVIHCLLLERSLFDEQFVVASSNLPSENTKIVIDSIYNRVKEGPGLLDNYSLEILEILKDIKLHQSLKTDSQRIDKIINQQSTDYFEYLKSAEGKTIIDNDSFDRCLLAVESIESNNQIMTLLGSTSLNPEKDIYNEYPLQIEPSGYYPFGFKGVLDNIRVDSSVKIIYINDLKTTGRSLVDFESSIIKYNYWAQAAMYVKLVSENFKVLMDDGYEIVFNFIVVDKFNQVYPFEVSDTTMSSWITALDVKLNEAVYHYNTNDYNLPFRFATGKVIL